MARVDSGSRTNTPPYNASQWMTEATQQIDIASGIESLVEALATPEYWPSAAEQEAQLRGRLNRLAEALRFGTPLYELTAALIAPYLLSNGTPPVGSPPSGTTARAVRANLVALLSYLFDSPDPREIDPWFGLAEWLWSHQTAMAGAALQRKLGHEIVRTLPTDEYRRAQSEYLANTGRGELRERSSHLLLAYAQDLAKAIVEMLDLSNASRKRRELLLAVRPLDDPAELLPVPRQGGAGELVPLLREGHLNVFGSGHYQVLREALSMNMFDRVEGNLWPTARLTQGGLAAEAQLRPPGADTLPEPGSDQLQSWVAEMWEQRKELSDLDADALDALCAIWIHQARSVHDRAVAAVDELLEMRMLQKRQLPDGRREGFATSQRQEMQRAVARIQNLYIYIDVPEAAPLPGDGDSSKRKPRTTRKIQSHAFVITDRLGQVDLSGRMVDMERFIFRPGEVFARFLAGPGSHTALLSATALKYDPYRQQFEKRLARYLSWQWRITAGSIGTSRPFRLVTLLGAVNHTPKRSRPGVTRDRLEQALDTLHRDGVIAGWRYEDWDESRAPARGWLDGWLGSMLLINPPPVVLEQYQALPHRGGRDLEPLALPAPSALATQRATPAPSTPADGSLSARMKAHRREKGWNQERAAADLGVTQGYWSRLERGAADRDTLPEEMRVRLESWLAR